MDINEVTMLGKEMKKQGLNAMQQLPNGYDHESRRRATRTSSRAAIVVPQFVALEVTPQIPEIKTFLD